MGSIDTAAKSDTTTMLLPSGLKNGWFTWPARSGPLPITLTGCGCGSFGFTRNTAKYPGSRPLSESGAFVGLSQVDANTIHFPLGDHSQCVSVHGPLVNLVIFPPNSPTLVFSIMYRFLCL
uniref:Uncharacterized protein n=1 Tax=Opuntia streptacantha TaxID=393608 RepID=A0A7C8YCL4_OPUST